LPSELLEGDTRNDSGSGMKSHDGVEPDEGFAETKQGDKVGEREMID
jgi:hypothetical protein